MNPTDVIRRTITSLQPDEKIRRIALEMFLEAVKHANTYGSDKWGVYYETDRVRLLVGVFIVFTIHRGRLWLALDKSLLEEAAGKRKALEKTASWQWDTEDYPEYFLVPSKNGFYVPGPDHAEIWPIIRELHFKFIENAAKKYNQLRKSSQPKHNPALLAYLRAELGQSVPEPNYDEPVTFRLPEEIPDEPSFPEGSKKKVTVNAYERNPKARKECIAYYGTSCVVCGFNFAEVYGEIGEGFIHVHHLKPLSDIGAEYEVDPINDLRPVCPNCHAMIHKRNPPYTIEEMKRLLRM